jgi:two-component system alkaline phosphatase synthesis response regulator PhoP
MARKILVVDDDGDILYLMRIMLRHEGWEMMSADGGIRAIEMARRYAPDLILLDMMMPDMDGVEVCERLRAEPQFRNTPILILTALTRVQEHQLARQAGANEVIVKPVTGRELVQRLQRFLPA